MRNIPICLGAVALGAAALMAAGQTPASTNPAASASSALITLTPEFDQTLRDLSAEDFKDRRRATQQLELAAAKLCSRMALINDAEAQAHVAEVMRFNAGLSAWLISVLALPSERRNKILAWGLVPEHVLLVARAYSTDPQERVKAARSLAPLSDPEASQLMAMLLADNDRDVHLAAMDALWDRPPTPEIIDALWMRSVVWLMEQYRPRVGTPRPVIKFRGEDLRPGMFDATINLRIQDNDVATRMLLHYDSPLVADKIVEVLQDELSDPTHKNHAPLFAPYGASKNVESLMHAFKSKKEITLLYALATSPTPDPPNGVFGAKLFHWNARLAAISTLVTLTSQDPGDYAFKKVPQMPEIWVVGNEADEKAAIAKLTTWWQKHHAEYEEQG